MVICHNTEPSGFLDTTNASPQGGTWSTSNTEISPFLSPNGFLDHDNMGIGTYHFIYTVNGCSDIMYLDLIGSDAGADTSVCPEANNFFLPTPNPAGGSWSSPDPIASANLVDPLTGEVEKLGLDGDYIFVYDNQGCQDSVLVTVCEDVEDIVFVPNIFSPNGDLENDVLKVFGENLDWVHIKIYDRWGELVFESTSAEQAINIGWDGTYEGKVLTPQVFVYYLEGAYLEGNSFFIQGNITLVK
jgi:gliding motility-associated-like protein